MKRVLILIFVFIIQTCYVNIKLENFEEISEFDPEKQYLIVLHNKKELIAKKLFKEGNYYHYFVGNQEKVIPLNEVEELQEREFSFAGTFTVVATAVATIFLLVKMLMIE